MAVETLIREQFGTFMYNNGKGHVINRAEYLRYIFTQNITKNRLINGLITEQMEVHGQQRSCYSH